jgi:Na+/panthothenate symporter
MIVREEKYLNRLMWMFPVIGIFVTAVAAVLGLGGAVHFPGLESGDQVIGQVTSVVPPMIGALATVGIIAATMSTADSILLSVGFIVSEQWYRGSKTTNTKAVLRLNRWCTLAVSIFAFIASIKPELITEFAFNAFGGMLQLAPVMFAGVYEWRIGKVTAFVSALSGLSLVVLGTTPLYSMILPAELPPYFAGFLLAMVVILIGRVSGTKPASAG